MFDDNFSLRQSVHPAVGSPVWIRQSFLRTRSKRSAPQSSLSLNFERPIPTLQQEQSKMAMSTISKKRGPRVEAKQGKMKMKLGSVNQKGGGNKLKKEYLPKRKRLQARARIAAASDSSSESDDEVTVTQPIVRAEKKQSNDYTAHDSDEKMDDREENEHSSDDGDDDGVSGNPGWADAMLKVLKTGQVAGRPIVMAKGQTDRQVAAKLEQKPADFQVLNADGTPAEPTVVETSKRLREMAAKTLKEASKQRELRKLMKKAWERKGRVQPDITKKDLERQLVRIATKGVVQLFNAVKDRQSTITKQFDKVGGSEVKRDKIMKSMTKGKFLDSLNSKTKSVTLSASPLKSKKAIRPATDEKSKPTWNILRDDYMMGATMKDWDKESDSDEDQ